MNTFIRVPNNSYIHAAFAKLQHPNQLLSRFRFVLEEETGVAEITNTHPVAMRKILAPVFNPTHLSRIADILNSESLIDTVVVSAPERANCSLINFHILLPALQTQFPHVQFIGEDAVKTNQIVITGPEDYRAMLQSLHLAQRIRHKGCLE